MIYLHTTDRRTVNYYSTIHAMVLSYFDNKRRKHILSLQLLPTFCHCTEELPPILRLRHIRLHVIVTSLKRKNDVTPSNAMNDVIFQWRQLSHTLAVNYCPIYHSLLPLALKARCVRIIRCLSPTNILASTLDFGTFRQTVKSQTTLRICTVSP